MLILIGALLLALPAQADSVEKPPLLLKLGEQRLLRVPGLARYSVGDPVVKIHPLAKSLGETEARESLLLRGMSPGTGDLWVWKEDGSSEHRSIRVEKGGADELPPAMARSLSRLESCEIFFAGPAVVLRGRIDDEREAGRVWALARAFPRELLDETEISERILARGRESLERAVKTIGKGAALRIEQAGSTLWVRGSVERPADLGPLEKRLRAAFAPVELELDALPDSAPTVHFKVFLLELRKSRIGNLGLTWPALQEGAFRVTTGGIQDLLQLDLTLQALEGDGSVHVLSNPELVVRAPGEAQLFAGGELPISMRTHYSQSISWKNYGLTLKLKVTGTTAEKVRLEVFTEVSRLDPALTMEQVPALQTNRMNTAVDARYGVPLFLSGLLQQGTRESARGLPLLRSLPILGALFGSEDYLNDRSELVAILLPNLEPPQLPTARLEAARRHHAKAWREHFTPHATSRIPPGSPYAPWPLPEENLPDPPEESQVKWHELK